MLTKTIQPGRSQTGSSEAKNGINQTVTPNNKEIKSPVGLAKNARFATLSDSAYINGLSRDIFDFLIAKALFIFLISQ